MPKPRTAPWDRRRDKDGGYARTRRAEKALDRQGLEDREILVGWIATAERIAGKFGFGIYIDRIRRKRPDGRKAEARVNARAAARRGDD